MHSPFSGVPLDGARPNKSGRKLAEAPTAFFFYVWVERGSMVRQESSTALALLEDLIIVGEDLLFHRRAYVRASISLNTKES